MDKSGDKRPIESGDVVNSFQLTDELGQTRSLSDALKAGPLILVYYRGDW